MSDYIPKDQAKIKADAWHKHLNDILDRICDSHDDGLGPSDDYLNGFTRAIEEGEVNLQYYIEGTLPKPNNLHITNTKLYGASVVPTDQAPHKSWRIVLGTDEEKT